MEHSKNEPEDLTSQVKRAGFDIACILLIFGLFANLSRHFDRHIPAIKYDRLVVYGLFLTVATATLRQFKKSLAHLFINALFIGFAANMANQINYRK
jgi:cyanate permease